MRRSRAFSLIEVVIAVGVFAVAITAILALLPMVSREAADSADRLLAEQFADVLTVELQGSVGREGLAAFASSVPVMSVPLEHGRGFVAPRDGLPLRALAAADSREEDYFLVEIWRFNAGPLAQPAGAAVLPLYARVSWPYRVKGRATPVTPRDRSEFTFTLAVNP